MMRCLSKYLFLLGMMLCAATFTMAQESDTTYIDSTGAAEMAGVPEEDYTEAPQAVPVSYNKAAPTAEQWRQATSGKEFGYKDEREFTPSAKPMPKPEESWIFRVITAFIRFITSPAGHALLWIILGCLVAYIAYRIFAGDGNIFGRRNKKINQKTDESSEISEEDLLLSNWEERLRAATAAGDTRMAIRYSYMLLLQLLQARNLIQYRQDKTNTDYYRELSESPVRQQFRQLSREYEYAWYGNFLPSAEAFSGYLQLFNSVKKGIGAS